MRDAEDGAIETLLLAAGHELAEEGRLVRPNAIHGWPGADAIVLGNARIPPVGSHMYVYDPQVAEVAVLRLLHEGAPRVLDHARILRADDLALEDHYEPLAPPRRHHAGSCVGGRSVRAGGAVHPLGVVDATANTLTPGAWL